MCLRRNPLALPLGSGRLRCVCVLDTDCGASLNRSSRWLHQVDFHAVNFVRLSPTNQDA